MMSRTARASATVAFLLLTLAPSLAQPLPSYGGTQATPIMPVDQYGKPAVPGSSGSTISTSQPSVGTTASAISQPGSFNHREIINPSTNTVTIFYGGSGVTAATGIPLPPGSSSGDLSRFSGALYAIAGSTVNVALLTY